MGSIYVKTFDLRIIKSKVARTVLKAAEEPKHFPKGIVEFITILKSYLF